MTEPARPVLLLVDDQPSNVRLLAESLREDYELRFATSGEKAVEIVEGGGIDLVLLDVVMPGLGGFEVCRRIRKSGPAGEVPVIFVTALERTGAAREAIEAGGVECLTKPVDPAVVRERIEAHLRESSRHQPPQREANQLRVLLVDDDELSRTVHHHYLTSLGHAVDEADNGAVAIERTRMIRYDWIFVDLEMPVMNGFETVTELRRQKAETRPAIVALSAHDDPAVKRRALAAGFDRYLEKPVTRTRLAEVLSLPARQNDESSTKEVDDDLEKLVPAFLANKRADVDRMRDALRAGDHEKLRSLSHKLRGALALYGFRTAADRCVEIEEALRDRRDREIPELIDAVSRALDQHRS